MFEKIEFLTKNGGFAAWLILLSALFLVAFGFERLFTLFVRMSFNVVGSMDSIRANILEKRYTEALQVCNIQPKAPELSVIKAGLTAMENGREAMKSSLGAAVLEITHKCETRIGYIALIANVATLLGLLGTISGLIKTFASIANASPAEKGVMLGNGISEAMYSTASGLLVGIMAMVVHTLCTSKVDDIVGSAQDAGLKLITWVEQSERVRK